MRVIVGQLAVLFIIVLAGYLACKIKALSPETGKILTKVVFNITLPCTILSTVAGGDLAITGSETAFFMLFSLLAFLIFFLFALVTSWALGRGQPGVGPGGAVILPHKENRGLFSTMIVLGNVTFMGLPVSNAIFGPESALYVALFNIPFWIINFSVAPVMISSKGGKFDPKLLLNPSLAAALLVIPLAIAGFRAPAVVADVLRLTGSVTTPAAMLIIGITLAQVPVRHVFSEWRLYPLAFVKLVAAPVVVWLIFRQFIANDLMLGVLVVLSAMPTAANVAMLAIEYKGNARIASSGVFLTTLLSGATVPLIVYFLLI